MKCVPVYFRHFAQNVEIPGKCQNCRSWKVYSYILICFWSPFLSKSCGLWQALWLCPPTVDKTLKCFIQLPILINAEWFWWWQCIMKYCLIPHPLPPSPTPSNLLGVVLISTSDKPVPHSTMTMKKVLQQKSHPHGLHISYKIINGRHQKLLSASTHILYTRLWNQYAVIFCIPAGYLATVSVKGQEHWVTGSCRYNSISLSSSLSGNFLVTSMSQRVGGGGLEWGKGRNHARGW